MYTINFYWIMSKFVGNLLLNLIIVKKLQKKKKKGMAGSGHVGTFFPKLTV